MLVADASVVGHDGHVARHHEFHAAGEGVAVHHRDGGDGQLFEAEERLVQVADIGGKERQVVEGAVKVKQVGAGAESSAGALARPMP